MTYEQVNLLQEGDIVYIDPSYSCIEPFATIQFIVKDEIECDKQVRVISGTMMHKIAYEKLTYVGFCPYCNEMIGDEPFCTIHGDVSGLNRKMYQRDYFAKLQRKYEIKKSALKELQSEVDILRSELEDLLEVKSMRL